MGQGTESCGGYEVDYDEYEDGLTDGFWVERTGHRTHVTAMTDKHLKNTLRMVTGLARCSTFESEQYKWESWVDIIEQEIARRVVKVKVKPSPPKPIKGVKVKMICFCGKEYEAREADLKRGWGLSCSKSHAAIRRTYAKPAAKRA